MLLPDKSCAYTDLTMRRQMTAPTSRWFANVYYLKGEDLGRKDRARAFPKLVHKTRDGLALLELSHMLARADYEYEGPILQVPKEVREGRRLPQLRRTTASLTASDLLVQATRPPLDDTGKRSLDRSGTRLEGDVFRSFRKFASTCSRSAVILSPSVTLPQAFEGFRQINFYKSGGGLVESIGGKSADKAMQNIRSIALQRIDAESLAVGYLFSTPQVRKGGPRLVLSFSMGGAETLWFCHLLRTQLYATFSQALRTRRPCLWIVPFCCPNYTPDGTLWLNKTAANSPVVIKATI